MYVGFFVPGKRITKKLLLHRTLVLWGSNAAFTEAQEADHN